MKKIFFTLLLFLVTHFSFADTSYWVYYESVLCYTWPPNDGSWGGSGDEGSDDVEVEITYPLDFIIMEDSTFQLTYCIDCKLHSSEYLLKIYDYKFVGDSILEFYTRQITGLHYTYVDRVFQYKKINPSINLDLNTLLKNNPKVFRNEKSLLFQDINLLGLPDSLTEKKLFYRLEQDIGNMYNVYVEDKKGSRYTFDILFYLIDKKLYYETISSAPSHDCGDCTIEEAKKEIQLVTRNRWKLLE
ncbi:hypothetical protein ACE193_00725 [Bernardetia sp. OM2101]|uniref:hypothetical protein n=1 Tax=Bernardetia sp. OM2101 TaxID=3344876 RepID=UPI0035D0B06D